MESVFFDISDDRLHSQIGKIIDNKIVSNGEEGFLLYGPYIPWEKGTYRLNIYGEMISSNFSNSYIDVTISEGNQIISRYGLQTESSKSIIGVIDFELIEDTQDIEFRIWLAKGSYISVSHYEISPIPKLVYCDIQLNTLPYVLITGNIRAPEILLNQLSFFNTLKQDKLISQIVFSTWKGEIEKYPSILQKIQELKCILVESEEPEIICRGHYLHQMAQLENGLNSCPDNSFILRTRTDRCGAESGFIEEQIRNFLLRKDYIRPCNNIKNIFLYRIGTFEPHTTVSLTNPILFFWLDRWYFGHKNDLLKLVNHSILSFDYDGLIPEQTFFSFPFKAQWSVITAFFQSIKQVSVIEQFFFSKQDADKIAALTTFLTKKRLFKHAFLVERYILSHYFFDIPSGQNIPLITSYNGNELGTSSDMDCITSHHCCINYDSDIQDIKDYLSNHFDIEPVQKREIINGPIKRYIYHRKHLTHYTFQK